MGCSAGEDLIGRRRRDQTAVAADAEAAGDVKLLALDGAVARRDGGRGVVGIDDDRSAGFGEGAVALGVQGGLVVVIENEHADLGGDPGAAGDGPGLDRNGATAEDSAEGPAGIVRQVHFDVAVEPLVGAADRGNAHGDLAGDAVVGAAVLGRDIDGILLGQAADVFALIGRIVAIEDAGGGHGGGVGVGAGLAVVHLQHAAVHRQRHHAEEPDKPQGDQHHDDAAP